MPTQVRGNYADIYQWSIHALPPGDGTAELHLPSPGGLYLWASDAVIDPVGGNGWGQFMPFRPAVEPPSYICQTLAGCMYGRAMHR